jgi:hypothetical protein
MYGFVARSREHAMSDVDAMVIGRAGFADLSPAYVGQGVVDRISLSPLRDGDGSEGDPHPGIPVLQRSGRLDYETSPVT